MTYYIGIDLGTTNSAISTFDGEKTRVWKNKKDQSDVTPSVIYVDKRDRRFYGKEAYSKLSQHPDRTASLFKRLMGTSTKIKIAGKEVTPEECSAEILRELFKNLPEEIRESDDNAVVITVPAAFDQLQNNATLKAAKIANLGSKVKLIQEPVAAIMSVMKVEPKDATFLIFDLGGGTLDVAIAMSSRGKVNLLAHNGIAMCGGRDFDRIIMNNTVLPWLYDNYSLPDNLIVHEKYKKLASIGTYLSEIAKIELSSDEEATIEGETGITDENGDEIYLDIRLDRATYNKYIDGMTFEAIKTARETIESVNLRPEDFDRIIFVGGPTNYKPTRDIVTRELGIKGSIEVNPMTAVAEGASIFAESVDWSSDKQSKKSSRGELQSVASLGLNFKYEARVSTDQARFVVQMTSELDGYTLEIISVETGWRSGNIDLKNGKTTKLPLAKMGENKFDIKVLDNYGRTVRLDEERIEIIKAVASVDSILAAHSMGFEITEGGSNTLAYIVRKGDILPIQGEIFFKATETVKAGSDNAIRFKLWQGEIESKVEDNKWIGVSEIRGSDFDYGRINIGDRIRVIYTISDSYSITECTFTVMDNPTLSNDTFPGRYNTTEAELDMAHSSEVIADEAAELVERVNAMSSKLLNSDERLEEAKEKAIKAMTINNTDADVETVKKASDDLASIKILLDKVRKDNLETVRADELDFERERYEKSVEPIANSVEKGEFNNMLKRAEQVISRSENTFEKIIEEFKSKCFITLFRNDEGFVVGMFQAFIQNPYDYNDIDKFKTIKATGIECIRTGDIDKLRNCIVQLLAIQKPTSSVSSFDRNTIANIMRG